MRLKCKYRFTETIIVRQLEENEVNPKLGEEEFADETNIYKTVESIDDGLLIDIRDKKDGEDNFYYVGVVVGSDGHIYVIELHNIIVEI